MANPKRKISRSKRDKRRANWFSAMKPKQLSKCSNCGAKKLPHRVCPECGYYKGELVIQPENK